MKKLTKEQLDKIIEARQLCFEAHALVHSVNCQVERPPQGERECWWNLQGLADSLEAAITESTDVVQQNDSLKE